MLDMDIPIMLEVKLQTLVELLEPTVNRDSESKMN